MKTGCLHRIQLAKSDQGSCSPAVICREDYRTFRRNPTCVELLQLLPAVEKSRCPIMAAASPAASAHDAPNPPDDKPKGLHINGVFVEFPFEPYGVQVRCSGWRCAHTIIRNEGVRVVVELQWEA